MIVAMFVAAQAVTNMIPTEAVIDPNYRLVEGIASDGRRFWLSSVIDRKILLCPRRRSFELPRCRTFATLPTGLHPLGLAWDSARKRLWVAADCPRVAGIAKCERGALVSLDLRGRVRARISPLGGSFHPGDVSAAGGRVFVSDSQSGLVFTLLPSGRAIMAVNLPGDGKSAQGTALAPDGEHLVVADYSRGIGVIDLATLKTKWLPRQDGKPLRGVDGLVRCGSTYFGIYNGSDRGTLLSFTLGDDGIDVERPLGPTAGLLDPTQIAYDGKRLLVVGNSGWAGIDKSGARTKGASVEAIPLTAGCETDLG